MEETNLLRITSVTRRKFDDKAKDLQGNSLANKSYLEVGLVKAKDFAKKVIGGMKAKKSLFKTDKYTAEVYDYLWDIFVGQDGKTTLKVDETVMLEGYTDEPLYVEGFCKTIDLPTLMRRKDETGKWQKPISSISVVCFDGESPKSQANRIIESFGYMSVEGDTHTDPDKNPILDNDDSE